MTNQSELDHELDQLFGTRGMEQEQLKERLVAYITANYTPNSEVEQLKSRNSLLEWKIKGLKKFTTDFLSDIPSEGKERKSR